MSPRRWDFISANGADFGVLRIDRVLGASRAGYCRHLATEQARAERQAEEKQTVSETRAVYAEHQGAYGAPRLHAELRARGRRINRKRVTWLMRINHIVGRHLRKEKRTTIADRTAPPTSDLVMRDFTADPRPDIGQHGLGAGAATAVAVVLACRIMLLITEVIGDLAFQRRFQDPCGQLLQQPPGPVSRSPSDRARSTSIATS